MSSAGNPEEPFTASPETIHSIERALAGWDRSAAEASATAAETLRKQFVARFPVAAWPTLPLERYALGQTVADGTVSWWLEFHTREIASISGGSSFKHLIFKAADGQWRYPARYDSVDAAWDAVRAGFVQAFNLADEGKLEDIESIDALGGAPAVVTKALYMYFPDRIFPVCSSQHVVHFLSEFGLDPDPRGVLPSNLTLMRVLHSVDALSGLSSHELMSFLYHWSDPRSVKNVVKIAPGEEGRFWEDCRTGSYICVGWDDIGDLTNYATKEEFRAAFSEAYSAVYNGHASTLTRKSNELWTLMTLEPGDKVIANRGINEVLAIGTVNNAGYAYRTDRPEYRHTLGVDWDLSTAGRITPIGAWRTTTVKKVSASQLRDILGTAPAQTTDLCVAVEDTYLEIENALRQRGQVILYGPPGTGKTYYADRAAAWFLAGGSADAAASAVLADQGELSARINQYTKARRGSPRVWVMVANPKLWAWSQLLTSGPESFHYGHLRRNYPNVRAGDLVAGYEASPTKRIVALARITNEYDPDAPPEAAITLEAVSDISNGPSLEDLRNDPVLADSEPVRFGFQGTLFALNDIEADRLLTLIAKAQPNLADDARSSTPRLTRVTFHPSYTYEDFIEGFRPNPSGNGGLELRLTDGVFKKVCAAGAAEPDQPFVVLIDEINRGNIAKIFGELITLIEHDKRGAFSVRLPQSGDEFTIPPNVYIIATMNTADRSIQMLDTALRRRFRFIELMPDSETLQGVVIAGLSLQDFLDHLNDKIRQRVGRERQVGHALFFQNGTVVNTPSAFADIFRHELLPLVQEYLYDSYADLADVFGRDVVDPDTERVTALLDDPETLCRLLADTFGATPG